MSCTLIGLSSPTRFGALQPTMQAKNWAAAAAPSTAQQRPPVRRPARAQRESETPGARAGSGGALAARSAPETALALLERADRPRKSILRKAGHSTSVK